MTVTLLVCEMPLLEEPKQPREENDIWKTLQQAEKGAVKGRAEGDKIHSLKVSPGKVSVLLLEEFQPSLP